MSQPDYHIVGPNYGKKLLAEGKATGTLLLEDLVVTAKPYVAGYLLVAVDCFFGWLQEKISTR